MILKGDSLEVMKTMEENSVDTIICDPPYGLSFMGKKWDYDVPSVELWQEALRVLKPGGTALIFAGSRTQHRMAVNVEDAGFILKDTIMWLYGSGFPKATDISKQLDKGHERKVVGIDKSKLRPNRKSENEGGTRILAGGLKSDNGATITEPSTPEAKLWNGWKSHGLKPAYEPILVAMKSNEGTYAANALKHGVSGLNIDGGRIEPQDEKDLKEIRSERKSERKGNNQVQVSGSRENRQDVTGRFPANIILDEEAGKMLDEQSGVSKSVQTERGKGIDGATFKNPKGDTTGVRGHNDKGGASRFFYCAKASKKERNAGCEELEEKTRKVMGDMSGGTPGQPNEYTGTTSSNHHPTVKPLALMEYLATLTKTPTGGTVLDMFAGSGSTGVACINTDRDFILIEREEEYIPIIEARIKQAQSERESKLF